MTYSDYYRSVFNLVEHLANKEVLDTAKHLLVNYMEGCSKDTAAERARYAIFRYMSAEFPSLAEIQQKSTVGKLNKLDHLILKMEWEASRVTDNL